jgi:hypothetical protein
MVTGRGTSDAAWTWTRHVCAIDGYPDDSWVEWRGDGAYRATVTASEVAGHLVWQATVHAVSGDQRSPYRRTRLAAQRWAERYGQPKRR